MPENTHRIPLRWHRIPALACLISVAACGGEAGAPDDSEAASVGETAEALVTCDVIQRGVSGTVEDAQVSRDLADPNAQSTNFGALATFVSSKVGSRIDRDLIKFDVSAIPSNATVTSATITLQAQSTGSTSVQVRRLTGPWSEGTITWNTHTALVDPALLTTFSDGGAGYSGPLAFDLTSLAQSWVDGTYANNGILLGQTVGQTTFQASEAATTSLHPRLDICYTVPTCSDGIQNGSETGVDCGGSCPPCSSPGAHLWSRGVGSSGSDSVEDVAVDAAGNTFAVGYAGGTSDFGGGPLASAGGMDAFVAKYDPAGNLLWGKLFGDAYTQYAWAGATDPAGNVLVAGEFTGTINFGLNTLVANLNVPDIFVAKLSPNGTALWSRRFGTPTAADVAYGVGSDAAGNTYVGGSYGLGSIFMLKLTPAGQLAWSKFITTTGSSFASIHGLAVDPAGQVVLTGHYNGTIDFGGGPLPTTGNTSNTFIARLDTAGNQVFANGWASGGDTYGWSAGIDHAGNMLLTGTFRGAIDFGGGPINALSGVYIVKLDAAGNHIWSKAFSSFGNVEAWGIAADSQNNVLFTGETWGNVDFGGGVLGPPYSATQADGFLVKLDSSGSHLFSNAWAGFQITKGKGVVAGPSDTMIFGGNYGSTPNFGGGPLPNLGGGDGFIVTLAP